MPRPSFQPAPIVLAIAMALSLGLATPGASAQADSPVAISLPAQPLGSALNELARQARLQLMVSSELVANRQAPAVAGQLSVREALARLLEGSGLVAQVQGTEVVVRPAPVAPGAQSTVLPTVKVTAQNLRDGTTEGTGSYQATSTNTATKLNLSPLETPQSITVLTRQQLDDQGVTQLSEAFNQVPGVSFERSGSQGTDGNAVYSRGFVIENYQVDGVPQLNSWLLETSDLVTYDRIEVLRGATGLLNGKGTPAATINLVRKRPAQNFQASANVSLGSWNFKRAEADVSSPLNAAGTLRGRLVAAHQDNDSWIDRLAEKRNILYGVVEADLGSSTQLGVGLEYQRHKADAQGRSGMPLFYADGSLTDFPRSQNSAANWAHSYQTHRSAFVTLDHRFDNAWVFKANVGQTRRKYDDVVGYIYGGWPTWPNADNTDFNLLGNKWNAEYVQNALDAYVSGPFQLFGRRHEAVIGYNISRTTYNAPGYNAWQILPVPSLANWNGDSPAEPAWVTTSMTNFQEKQSGVYGTLRFKPTDKLAIFTGARLSQWSQNTTDTDYASGSVSSAPRKESGVFTPYVGAVYEVTPAWSLYASYTDIFKPQSNWVRDTAGRFLDPETGTNLEFGTKHLLFDGRLNLSAAYLDVRQDNLAVTDGTNLTPDGNSAYRSIPGARTKGYEIEVSGEPVIGWNVSAGYSHRTSKDSTGAPVNTTAPRDQFKLFSTYRTGVGRGLTIGGGVRWQGSIYTDGAGPNGVRFTQGSYAVVDLMARYPVTDKLTLTANLNNVFDKTYYTTVYTAYYGAPRNLRVNLLYTF